MRKSSGITPTERHLARLCEKTFLRMWSYPNPHRWDKRSCKELCDVLVVFNHDVIIFSDKSCAYPDTGDEKLDWARWFRKAIGKSASQIYGAERSIRAQPDNIYLDPDCRDRLPLSLPPSKEMRVHRVVVARGAGERCSAFFGGDSGSLMVNNCLLGASSHINSPLCPFQIGQIDPGRGYVHVLDDANLDILLTELDTVADFVAYLVRKESFLCSGKAVIAHGEEDLLAHYLTNTNDKDEHEFAVPSHVEGIKFDNLYPGMRRNQQYINKKSADRVSYLIDNLIEHVFRESSNHTLITGNDLQPRDLERCIRILASEGRLRRRMLAKSLVDIQLSSSAEGKPKSRCVLFGQEPDVGYCFFVSPIPRDWSYDEHISYRAAQLAAYCEVLKLKYPALQHIVGYASEPLDGEQRSQDLVYRDMTNWTEQDAREARRIQIMTGFMESPTITHFRDEEYPTPPDGERGHRRRPVRES